jgi:group I intron endonuclease
MYICRALLKYGYSHFCLEIIEYCDIKDILERESYYINLLKPEYNLLQVAYSRQGFSHSEEARKKTNECSR